MIPRPPLVLYSKHDCPLCEEVADRLRHLNIPIEVRDIRSRLDWFERYRERVPVVVLPGGQEQDPPFTFATLESWKAKYR